MAAQRLGGQADSRGRCRAAAVRWWQ